MIEKVKKRVLETIEQYHMMEAQDKIILGVSGGPDSMCMLDVLFSLKEELEIELFVAHVNHQMRTEAKEEEAYVANYCKEKGIKFFVKSIDVKKLAYNSKIGTEEAGRNVRYAFFQELKEKVNATKIAIAHNRNDKVETVMMNILRGSGISGLKGIEAKREAYIRPIITLDREEIEAYCEEAKLYPKIDKTNAENIYTRNKIRNVVIPYIKQEFNPNIVDTIDRLSKLVTEEEAYMEQQTKKVYEVIVLEESKEEVILDLKLFNMQEKVIKSRVVLYTITRLFETTKGIEMIHIEDIIKLCEKNIGNKYLTPNKNTKVFVNKQKVYVSKICSTRSNKEKDENL